MIAATGSLWLRISRTSPDDLSEKIKRPVRVVRENPQSILFFLHMPDCRLSSGNTLAIYPLITRAKPAKIVEMSTRRRPAPGNLCILRVNSRLSAASAIIGIRFAEP